MKSVLVLAAIQEMFSVEVTSPDSSPMALKSVG